MSDNKEDIKVTEQVKVSAATHGRKIQIDTLALKDTEYADPEKFEVISTAVAETDGEPLIEGNFHDFWSKDAEGQIMFGFFPASGILEIDHLNNAEIDLTVVITLRERQQ